MQADDSPKEGILYVATGSHSMNLLKVSLENLRLVEPDVPVAVYTDKREIKGFEKLVDIFITTHTPKHNWNDKIEGMIQSPFEKTIYIDVDTVAIRPFACDLFEGLEYYPLFVRDGCRFLFEWEKVEYPNCITQFNTGVIAFKKYDTLPALQKWQKIRSLKPEGHDQPSFRAAVLETRTPWANLPAEFNFSLINRTFEPIRILHFLSDNKRFMTDPALLKKVKRRVSGISSGPISISVDFFLHYHNKHFHFRSFMIHTFRNVKHHPLNKYLQPKNYCFKLKQFWKSRF